MSSLHLHQTSLGPSARRACGVSVLGTGEPQPAGRPEGRSAHGGQERLSCSQAASLRHSTTARWLLGNNSTAPTLSSPVCKVRAALSGHWDASVTGGLSPEPGSPLYQSGAVIFEARPCGCCLLRRVSLFCP